MQKNTRLESNQERKLTMFPRNYVQNTKVLRKTIQRKYKGEMKKNE